jgi:hypothetical protein
LCAEDVFLISLDSSVLLEIDDLLYYHFFVKDCSQRCIFLNLSRWIFCNAKFVHFGFPRSCYVRARVICSSKLWQSNVKGDATVGLSGSEGPQQMNLNPTVAYAREPTAR